MTDLVERLRTIATDMRRLFAGTPWERDADTLTEAADALSSREGGEGWRPIETAPKDGALILTYDARKSPRAAIAVCWWAAYYRSEEGWMDEQDGEPDPTHWRPLPEPPALSREGGEGVQHAPEVNHAKPLSTEAAGRDPE